MADPVSQPDTDRLEAFARSWLQSVQAVWEPKLEDRQNDPNGTRFIFIDSESRGHSLDINSEGFVVQYSGPQGSTMAGRLADVPSQIQTRPGSPPGRQVPRAGRPVPARNGNLTAEEQVVRWVRESVGLSDFSLIARESKGDLVHSTILDAEGNYFTAIADRNGSVRHFEPVQSQPKFDVRQPEKPAREPMSGDTTRLLAAARDWLTRTTGINELGISEALWEEGRLRILFKDHGGNRFLLFVKPNETVEEFKPL